MKKNVIYGKDARKRLMDGVDEVAKTVAVTLGPKGKTVFIERPGDYSHLTKDGKTVAESIFPIDPVASMGAGAIKQAANRVCQDSGDGTTTTTILCQAIAKAGIEAVDKGHSPTAMKAGMDAAVLDITEKIKEASDEVKDDINTLHQIAFTSSNGSSEISDMIKEAFEKVTPNGMLMYRDSLTYKSHLKTYLGMSFDGGFVSDKFMNDKIEKTTHISNPLILISDVVCRGKLDIVGVYDLIVMAHDVEIDKWEAENGRVANQGERDAIIKSRPIVLIVDSMDDAHLQFIYANRAGRQEPRSPTGYSLLPKDITVLYAPGFGEQRKEILEDIAIATGGNAIFDDAGKNLKSATLEDMGQCDSIVITPDRTMIFGGKGGEEAINARVKYLHDELAKAEPNQKQEIRSRLAKLKGGIAVIHVGATTNVEQKEKRDRVEDAILATRAAIEEGVVVGGGMTLYRIATDLGYKDETTDYNIGYNIVIEAIVRPFMQLVENCDKHPLDIIAEIAETYPDGWIGGDLHNGYNAKTDKIEDLKKAGVIDPAKVLRTALENAVSVASTLMSTESVIFESVNEDRNG